MINADELRERMYHEAFETDSDMQKWDGGCWIRYKIFENVLDSIPTIDAVPVVRFKDCKYAREPHRKDIYEREACDGVLVCFNGIDTVCPEECGMRFVNVDCFCSDGERKEAKE